MGTPLTIPQPLDVYRSVIQPAVPTSTGSSTGQALRVNLGGAHMRLNASLAVQLALAWEQQELLHKRPRPSAQAQPAVQSPTADRNSSSGGSCSGAAAVQDAEVPGLAGAEARIALASSGVLPASYERGLATVTWPGRSQVRRDQCSLMHVPPVLCAMCRSRWEQGCSCRCHTRGS